MVNIRYILAAAALAGGFAAMAKDLKTEITVDRTVVPVERQATRLGSVTPELYSPVFKRKALGLYEYGEASEIVPAVSRLEPMNYGDTLGLTPYRGYATLGYFPAFNLGASAGYRIINKASTCLGAWLQYDGYSYKDFDSDRHPYGKLDGSYKNNTVALGVRLDQRVGQASRLSADVAYSFAALANPFYGKDFTQNRNDISANAAWWSRAGSINYHVNVNFDRFAFTKDIIRENPPLGDIMYNPAGETFLGFKSGLAYAADGVAPAWGLEIAADFLNQSTGGIYEAEKPGTQGIISVSPYYAFSAGRLHGRVGLKVDLMTGKEKESSPYGDYKTLRVAPDVLVDYNATSQFAVFARISGGETFNSLRSLSQITPFIPSWTHYGRSNIPVAVDAGFNIGPFKGFAASLFGGYAVANDWVMPCLSETFIVEDVKGWHLGVRFDYNYGSLVEASASFETAASGDYDKAYYLWRDRARWVAGASVTVRPVDKLSVGLDYKLRAQRSCYNYSIASDLHDSDISLGNVSDLSFSASYAFTEAFSVFARGENLLNKRYDILPGVAAQGLKGLVGVSLKF